MSMPMSSSKSKSGLSETPKSKVSTTPSPRVSKMVRGIADPSSPSPKPRVSLDRSKPTPTPKLSSSSSSSPLALADKQSPRTLKGSGLQSQLNLLQDELKKAKEHIALVEKEKVKSVEELKEAQKIADGMNEKLRDALVAQKRAKEESEIEKFRAIELEQAGIEATRKKEEEWQKDLEAVRNQHAVDVATLLSTTRELQLVQNELALAVDAKNQALIHADDATKIAEIHAEKNEVLSAEITRLKDVLDSKLEREASENKRMVLQLKEEIAALSRELETSKGIEEKLMERDVSIEHLNVDLEAAKLAESYACSLVEEWKSKVEGLEKSLEESNKLERSASESLDSVTKQLEGSNDLLHDAKAEICALKEEVASLEMTAERQARELDEAGRRLTEVKEEFEDMEKAADTLRSDLDALKEEKDRALNSEQVASSSVQRLLEEKARLMDEMRISKEEEERSKKAMESLASALHEVSAEARDAKEKLVCIQIEHENCEAQLEDLRLVLKATNEKYEAMLYDAKGEMDHLASAVKQSKYEYETSKGEWEQKELHLVDCVKQSEEESYDLRKAKEGLEILLKQAAEKAANAEQQEALLRGSLKEVEDEVLYLQGALGETKAESMKLKESFLDKENELQSMVQENEELRVREATSIERVDELTKRLEEATLKVQRGKNGELSDSEKDYDLLPKVFELSEDNVQGGEEKLLHTDALLQTEGRPQRDKLLDIESSLKDKPDVGGMAEVESVNEKKAKEEEEEEEEEEEKEVDSGETEYKMWESCKIEKKEVSPEREMEQESVDSKADGDDSFEQENGTNSSENVEEGGHSPSPKQNLKKKKPLLRKFGSLLKKKGGSATSAKQKEQI